MHDVAALNRSSPVPRYHQIAEAIRSQIARGELSHGDVLDPIRQAAEAWGVNLHTVRHAYTELARQGLVESRRAVGTRVLARATDLARPGSERAAPARESRADFVGQVAREALERHGMSANALADALTTLGATGGATSSTRDIGYVVECSQTQCEDLARQVEAVWDVDARPWCLDRGDEPPPGPIIATYFHYNELRRRWPRRLAGVRFTSITVDPRLERLVDERAKAISSRRVRGRVAVTLYEFDEPTLAAVRADLSMVLPASRFTLDTKQISAAAEALATDKSRIALVAPRVWGELSQAQRATGQAIEVRYLFADAEMDALGRALRWRQRHRST